MSFLIIIPCTRFSDETIHLGIIPAKTLKMSEAMVNTTINELLTMEEIIQRLDPETVADILLPKVAR